MRNDSQGSNHTEHSENFEGRNVSTGEHHVDIRGDNDEEIKLVPRVAKVASLVHGEPQRDNLEDTLKVETVVKGCVHLLADFEDHRILI